jgi:DNA-binding NarL/FixJ family response regulator
MLVRDDGCGIDPAVLQAGRDGHWGLSGMRERAERIGAHLQVMSHASAGTEIELSVLVSEAVNGAEGVQQYRQHQPDVTLMDLRLPDLSGIDAMLAIRAEFPDACIVMLTTFEGDVEVQRALAAGARGYLLKNMPPDELVRSIRQVLSGKKRVPPRVSFPACRAHD